MMVRLPSIIFLSKCSNSHCSTDDSCPEYRMFQSTHRLFPSLAVACFAMILSVSAASGDVLAGERHQNGEVDGEKIDVANEETIAVANGKAIGPLDAWVGGFGKMDGGGETSAIVINEVQASNNATIADEDGDFEDWIELYNTGQDTVWLHGYGLSDDEMDLYRWVFPEGSFIAPEEFLLIWASGKNRRIHGMPLHTNFSIRSEGEEVLLSSFTIPEGSDTPLIDRLEPTPIPTDYSFGRYPDGSANWRLFDKPTPGIPNSESSLLGITHPPEFSHRPGFYTGAFELRMDGAPPGTVIHCTFDGSTPTTDSPVCDEPVLIDQRDHEPNVFSIIQTGSQFWVPPVDPVFKGHVIRAMAVRPGYRESEVVTGTWFVHPDGQKRYSFPVVSIAADPHHFFSDSTGILVPGDTFDPDDIVFSGNYNERGPDWERPAHLTFFDIEVADPFGRVMDPLHSKISSSTLSSSFLSTSQNEPHFGFSQNIGVRIHGGSTRRYPLKSLRIYARSTYDWNPQITWPIFPGHRKTGSDESLQTWKRLLLRSSGNDWFHTMFKDAMVQSLVADRRIDFQAHRPSVVFINGEYWGIHNIRERFDGWYIETNYGIHRDSVAILGSNASVSHGNASDREHYIEMRRFARDQDLSQPENMAFMEMRMDLDNYLKYKTFQVYTANVDWPHNNIRFWRKRTQHYNPDASYGADGRWRWMIFDLDISFGFPFGEDAPRWAQFDHDPMEWITGTGNDRFSEGWVNDLFSGLINNGEFRHRFIAMLAGDLNTRYKPGFVTKRIADFSELYRSEIEEHQRRHPNSAGHTMDGWEEHVERMMEFAKKRPGYLRTHIMNHFGITDTVALDLQVTGSKYGHVVLDHIPIYSSTPGVPDDHSRWSGTFFKDIPVTLTALANDNARFLGWENEHGEPLDFNEIALETTGQPHEMSFSWVPDGDLSIVAVFEPLELTQVSDDRQLPLEFRLLQNYPNPFNHQTIIPYELPVTSAVSIDIHSVDGRLVRTIQVGVKSPGTHLQRLDTRGMASGVYLYRLRAASDSDHMISVSPGKMILIR